jgi:hypothetical protein
MRMFDVVIVDLEESGKIAFSALSHFHSGLLKHHSP